MRFRVAVAILFGALLAAAASGNAARLAQHEPADNVDLLLVLAADASNSVDAREHLLQREGYASAITNPKVLRAIMTSGRYGRIAVCYVEWSGPEAQELIADWTVIAGPADAARFGQRLRFAPRAFADRTSISAAIDFAMAQFWRSPYEAARRVIDISGDGTNTSGRDAAEARDEAIRDGATINALVIMDDGPASSVPSHTNPPGGLKQYFEANVIGGKGAFAITADGFETFGSTLVSKLIREIARAPADAPVSRHATALD